MTKEKVKVPAGEFEAMKVVSAIDNGGSTLWLVKGIGPVKIQFDLGQGDKAVLELKTMTLTK